MARPHNFAPLDPRFRDFILKKFEETQDRDIVLAAAEKKFRRTLPGYVTKKRVVSLIYHHFYYNSKRKENRAAETRVTRDEIARGSPRGFFTTMDTPVRDQVLSRIQSLRDYGYTFSTVVEKLQTEFPDLDVPSPYSLQRALRVFLRNNERGDGTTMLVSLSGAGIKISDYEITRKTGIEILQKILGGKE